MKHAWKDSLPFPSRPDGANEEPIDKEQYPTADRAHVLIGPPNSGPPPRRYKDPDPPLCPLHGSPSRGPDPLKTEVYSHAGRVALPTCHTQRQQQTGRLNQRRVPWGSIRVPWTCIGVSTSGFHGQGSSRAPLQCCEARRRLPLPCWLRVFLPVGAKQAKFAGQEGNFLYIYI
ncbi:unnamed protein product [Calypogeia fissa]